MTMDNLASPILDRSNMLAMPDGLTTRGKQAYQLILTLLLKHEITSDSTGGCKTFYSPSEWRAKGETCGKGAVLIVVYDGGDVKYHFSMDAAYESAGPKSGAEVYEKTEGMQDHLGKHNFLYEELRRWCCAVYDQ